MGFLCGLMNCLFALSVATGSLVLYLVKRWPVILTAVIDNVHNTVSALYISSSPSSPNSVTNSSSPSPSPLPAATNDAKIREGKELIAELSKLKYEMGRDRILPLIPDDGGLDLAAYNAELETLERVSKRTWFTAPWLFAEYACRTYSLSSCIS